MLGIADASMGKERRLGCIADRRKIKSKLVRLVNLTFLDPLRADFESPCLFRLVFIDKNRTCRDTNGARKAKT